MEGDDILKRLLGEATKTNPYTLAASFVPGVMQTLGGIFGKNKTSEATVMDSSPIQNLRTTYNAAPQLAENQRTVNTTQEAIGRTSGGAAATRAYRAINTDKLYANNKVLGDKFNKETEMIANKVGAQMDANKTNSMFREQRRRDFDVAEAELGAFGNRSMTGYASMANAAGQFASDKKRSTIDALTAALAYKARMAGAPGLYDRTTKIEDDE